jgi:hypothetical protein
VSELVIARMVLPCVTALALAAVLVPLRREPVLGRLMPPLLTLLAVGNLGLTGFVWSRQVGFPLHLDVMEGTILQHVQRAAAGLPIYPPPAPDFVALAYNPLYYELGAAVGLLAGIDLPMLRMLSLAAATASGLILFVVVRRATRSAWWGLMASGLFAAAAGVMECYLATGHADAWFVFCALAGTLVLDRMPSRVGTLVGITLLVASFYFKQHGALFVLGGLAYVMLRDGAWRAWPAWALALVLGPVLYVFAGPRLFGPFFHYFTWEVPRRWGTHLRLLSLVRYVGFIGLFYPVLAVASVRSLARQWHRPDVWHVQLVFAMLAGLMGALDRGSAENVFIPMGTFFILVGTIGLAEWSAAGAPSPMPYLALLFAFVTLAYDPRRLLPSSHASAAYADLIDYLRALPGPVYAPWQGQLPSGFVLRPAAHWVALEDLVRGSGGGAPTPDARVRQLTAPVVAPTGPAFILANQPLDRLAVLAFLEHDYVLACDLGDRFMALRVLPKRYDHGWPRYLYRSRNQTVDSASLRRLCATS